MKLLLGVVITYTIFFIFWIRKGADCTMSLDGHDKLCGFQKAMFPLCIYGAQDTYSARINFLRIWTTNNNPKIIGKFYLDYLYEYRGKMLVRYMFFICLFLPCDCFERVPSGPFPWYNFITSAVITL